MSKKHVVRAIAMEVNGESYMGFEIPKEVIDHLKLVDGEILEAVVTDSSLFLEKTGVIANDDRSD